ncbi:Cyclic AMP-dependent transcription factor ATF-6 beta [Zootermopsis nevadensis]|uniref:Cyclic AMP-dependent transcription factor ATF-6 beta n=2 Tax=Zootermopsis nevadensis TaxID=136037 RepID=A0A067RAV8_ZOONE|nr:Cyclic AMP-dependent transcription factor ATF-6 beta [Zootermopsis nevadensis]
MKAIKRQQRMIKNRESACLSRKKKKEYVTSLENQISELQQENVQLKLENIALKERLSLYEENSTWKRPGVLNGNIRKTTAVLAVLFMVSFNIGSLGGLFHQGPDPLGELQGSPASQKLPSFRHGRSLLWSDMDRRNFPSVEDPFSDVNPISNTSNIHATCPMFINQTESIRLDSELRRWIGVDLESENLTHQPKPEVKSLGELLLPVPTTKPQSHKFKPKTKRKQQISRRQPAVSNEVEVYGIRPQYYNYAAFFEAIHRRDDTFYVVSFSGDHLLVPALAHNKTVRPKMSLVLPALPFNESMTAPPNHVTMMQIDCEVTNTQLLHVKKGDIPAHLRQNDTGHYSNSTASDKPSTKDQADDDFTSERRPAMTRSQPYRPYFVKPNHKKFMDNGEFPSEPKISVEFGSSNPYNITSNRMSNLSNVLSSKDYMKKDPRFT